MKVRFAICVVALAAVFAAVQAGEDPGAKYAKPGEEHKLLAKSVGTWKANVKFWVKPDEAPLESTGVMKKKMILGGRFLQEDFVSSFGGEKFVGMGMAGYDNRTKKFVNSWIDSMSTALMTSEGTYDAATKTFSFEGDGFDPATGKDIISRDVLRIVSDNEQVFEMHWEVAKGKSMKVMEITYQRMEEKKKEKDKKKDAK